MSDGILGAIQSINPFLLNAPPRGNVKRKEAGKASAAGKGAFASILTEHHERPQTLELSEMAPPANADLGGLLDDVHSAGDALSKRPCPEEIRRYKAAVRSFIRFVVDNAFSVEKSEGVLNKFKPQFKDRTGEARNEAQKYRMVGVIDQKLETLAAQIMAAQGKRLGFLAHIDEINGLLINLLR